MVSKTATPESAGLRKRFKKFDFSSESNIVSSARKGINPAVFYSFAYSIKMPEKNLATLLHIHPRTMGNYRDQQKSLAPVESEHLLKLIALFIKGEEIFGIVDEFNYWLKKPFWDTDEKPVDWLITPGGVDLVSDELDRLAHGYAV
jgi:putative toxin-antitoxin system antitoxin component (TIGR02293 family)